MDRFGGIPAGQFPRESDQRRLFGFALYRWDVRTGRRLSNIRWLVNRAGLFLWYRSLGHPLVREIAGELRSLVERIYTICESKSYRRGVVLGFAGGQHFDTQCNQIRACTQDMRDITNRVRWATRLDLRILVEAWGMGGQFGAYNAHMKGLHECLTDLVKSAQE